MERLSMEPEVRTIADVVGIVRRRKRAILAPAVCVFLIAATIAFLLPKTYESTTTILIEEQEVPREYVSANITSFADQRLQMINQRIMSTTKLLELIGRFNLYADLRDRLTVDEIVVKMRKDIRFNTISADVVDPRTGRPAQATIAFSITYEGQNPETVQRVANELASLYLEENLKTRERQSSETSKFMDDEMGNVQEKMASLDREIAAYKERYITSLPELAQVNLQALDQADRDVARLHDQLRALREREGYLDAQLASTPPDLAHLERENLEALQVRLVDLKTRYSEEHPDVISTRAAIVELERRQGDASVRPGSGKPDNPAYVALASQLAGVHSEIDSVKRQVRDLEKTRDGYRRRIEASPRVEEGYRALVVQRNSLQAKYDELTKKALDARVAHGLETEQLGERFSVIDPARLPGKPASPNIPAILLIGMILGLGSGVGLAAAQESGDFAVRSRDHLARVVPFPVLAGIPRIVTAEDVASRNAMRRRLVAGTVIALVACAVVFHFLVLDVVVLWAKVMRGISL